MENTPAKKKYVLRRHKFYNHLAKVLIRPLLFMAFGYRSKAKYKIAKNEKVVVLSNHQTDLDPILIEFSFSKHLYPLGTDTVFHGLAGKLLRHCFGAIAKRKGETDLNSVASMSEVMSEGGSLLFFPEGNRSYAEFQYFISSNLPLILKGFKANIVLFNIHGGTGTHPRWKDKHKRKGNFYGEINEVLSYEEIKDMPNDVLYERIRKGLVVNDSASGDKYVSKYRAQYLEKMLFVCPKCGKANALRSELDQVVCQDCGLKVALTEDLHLTSEDPDFRFSILNDWYQYQKRWMKELRIKENSVLFEDDDIIAYQADPFKKRRPFFEGKIVLTDTEIILGTKHFDVSKISASSAISGNRFSFSYEGHQYLVVGSERFNPLKYVFAFHRLDTLMARENLDQYYTLED